MKFILALDQGTTSSRAILFDHAGGIHAVAQQEFAQHFPAPGWVEHDPQDIWRTQLAVAQEVLANAGITADSVAAIGITNQRETTVVWDRNTGEPVGNAIVWQDRRTAEFCDTLKSAGHEETIRARTGLVIDAYFSGSKVRWILDNVPGARARAERGELAFGTVDSWLIWQLSGGQRHVTDASNASRTMLYNIHSGDWDDELLALLEVPRTMLPTVCASSGEFATTEPALFGAALAITGVAGDQQAALFGQACHAPGMVKNTYGTGCFLLMNTGDKAVPSANNLLTTVAWRLGDVTTYALEGSIFMGGAVVQWLRDGLGIIRDASAIEELAASVADNGGVVLVPAFVGLGAPHWDQYARGTIVGLTRGSGAAHIARAALESIALQTVDVIRAMEADAGIDLTELRVDGGASANNLLMQIQADALGVQVVRPGIAETTALGAAYLAGLAVGYWRDQNEIAAQWQEQRRFEPSMSAAARDAQLTLWHRALERAKGWAV